MTAIEHKGKTPRVINFHAHMLDRHVAERGANGNVATGFGGRPRIADGAAVSEKVRLMLDPAAHVQGMDSLGIDIEVLSSSTVTQGTAWADPRTALELNRRVNDAIAGWARDYPERIVGSFTLPLQDPKMASGELERAVFELGLRVVNLPANVENEYLGAPAFRPLWEAIADLDLVAFIHPDGVRDRWFQDYMLWGSVGQMLEETKVLVSLIYEGVLEALPNLKVVIAHGGGYLPHYSAGLDRNADLRPDTARNLTRKPTSYLRNVHYDTCVHDPVTLRSLIARVGADRVVLGSDYPGGDQDPVSSVLECEGLDEGDSTLILGDTGARLLGIERSTPPSQTDGQGEPGARREAIALSPIADGPSGRNH